MSFVRLAPLALLALGACASRPGGSVSSSTGDQLVAVARTQEAAWNRGDLEGFMSAGYLRSEKLTFFSGGSVSHGYDAMLARYKKSYQSDGKEMGQLSFSALEAVPLDPDNAILRGHWQLHFQKQDDIGGLFTLLFVHTDAGWRIVHDHTSVDAKK